MVDLLPCPFCGGKAVMQSFSTQREKFPRYRVICDKCGVENGWEHFEPEETAEAWNTRYENTAYNNDEDYPSLFECSHCGWSCSDTTPGDGDDSYKYCPECGFKILSKKVNE